MNNKASASFIIRDALPSDVPALAALHVKTFNETHGESPKGPTYELRESQWQQAFDSKDKSWFCFVIENENHELIGFTKGVPYNHNDLSDFSRELSTLFPFRTFHQPRLRPGLLAHVAPD